MLDPPFPPDDYLCTWHLPGPDDSTVHLSGMIELRESRMPYGRVYGDLPLVSITTDNQSAMSFPQVHEYPTVRATLANGAELVVLDARVTFWPEAGSVRGAAAAVRKRANLLAMSTSNPPEAQPEDTVTFNAFASRWARWTPSSGQRRLARRPRLGGKATTARGPGQQRRVLPRR